MGPVNLFQEELDKIRRVSREEFVAKLKSFDETEFKPPLPPLDCGKRAKARAAIRKGWEEEDRDVEGLWEGGCVLLDEQKLTWEEECVVQITLDEIEELLWRRNERRKRIRRSWLPPTILIGMRCGSD